MATERARKQVQLARQAMATRWEMVVRAAEEATARAAGEEALEEVGRWDGCLSFYNPQSDIVGINSRAGKEPVKVHPVVYGLLEECQALWALSEGAFDITVAPLMRCWGFTLGQGHFPAEEAIARARELVGMNKVRLNRESRSIQFDRDGVVMELGAVGKGFAIDRAVEVLQEVGIEDCLMHGGTSMVAGMGMAEGEQPWTVAIELPLLDEDGSILPGSRAVEPLATVQLRNEALAVSAPTGKMFVHEGRSYGHVIDPRTGYPTTGAGLAAVVAKNGTEADALSTALLVLGKEGGERLKERRPDLKMWVAWPVQEEGGWGWEEWRT